ncbi:MAG: selenocysteine-specific translation elongation factor [Chloroflexota bacterium]
MSTVVIGTAGHIDHGKTTLLRALTGIDADRLPEERARGMTIDVGYAHLDLPDGSAIDFVDVPGHDRLVGNMLVGAGEIDAALLVVAADDGPRAQTLEHLELLDAIGIRDGLVVVTKVDLVDEARLEAVRSTVTDLLERTGLTGASVLAASGETGVGVDELRAALVELRDRVATRSLTRQAGPLRLAIDRAFAIKGRGSVVTGTLRGGSVDPGTTLRLEPGGGAVRVREVQVHNATVKRAYGGRTALNIAGAGFPELRRGQLLTAGPGIETSDRLLVALRPPAMLRSVARSSRPSAAASARRWPPADGSRLALHLGTAQVEVLVGRRGREAIELPDSESTAIVRLANAVATRIGDRGVLRRPESGETVAGVTVLDTAPARGVSRRRTSPERLAALATAVREADGNAAAHSLVAMHGVLSSLWLVAAAAALRAPGIDLPPAPREGGLVLAPDVTALVEAEAERLVAHHHAADPLSQGLPRADLRRDLLLGLRRAVTIDRSMAIGASAAVDEVVAGLAGRGVIARSGDRYHDPNRGRDAATALASAMARLEAALNVPAPPSLAEAAKSAGCPAEGLAALVTSGRIVRLEADLAWSAAEYQRLAAVALAMADHAPLTPAAFRDATGTSRRYVLVILEDLDRRGMLRRTEAGRVRGPRAPRGDAGAAPAGIGAER